MLISALATAYEAVSFGIDLIKTVRDGREILTGNTLGTKVDALVTTNHSILSELRRLGERSALVDVQETRHAERDREQIFGRFDDIELAVNRLQAAVGVPVACSTFIEAPERMMDRFGANPEDLLHFIRPLQGCDVPEECFRDRTMVPVTFERWGVYFIGWIKRGYLHDQLSCDYEPSVAHRLLGTPVPTEGPIRISTAPRPPPPPKPPMEILQGRWLEAKCVFRDWGKDGKSDPTLPEMVVIPAGTFMMGSPDSEPARESHEGPQHRVTIARPFALGRYAVSQAEWQVVMGSNPSRFKGDRNPVETVSWEDAQEFLKTLNAKLGLAGDRGYRLPSEAEWEYACRAGTTTPFWWGSTITPKQANYDGNYTYNNGLKGEYRQKTVPVDSFEPNPFGLYQMHGNVWEWCEDCWNNSYNGAPADGSAWTTVNCSLRVLRGGSWYFIPWIVRSAGRVRDAADVPELQRGRFPPSEDFDSLVL